MKKGIVALIVVLWVVTGVLSFGLSKVAADRVPSVYSYEGKVLMTVSEYSEFKAVVAQDEVRIVDMNVYASEDPLVVFEVMVPAGVEFRWGEGTPTSWESDISPWGYALLLLGAVATGMAGLILLGGALLGSPEPGDEA